mgnify:CR=1 FL=1|jgi:hypothetical protein
MDLGKIQNEIAKLRNELAKVPNIESRLNRLLGMEELLLLQEKENGKEEVEIKEAELT